MTATTEHRRSAPGDRRGVPSLRESLDGLLGEEPRPTWAGATVLHARIGVDPGAARDWLPRALRLPTDEVPTATVFVADYPTTSFAIAYRESGLLLHARHRGRDVLHCVWMVVDDDSAMILGRELFGFPKKMADIELRTDPATGLVTGGSVRRRDEELLRIDTDFDGDFDTGADAPGGVGPEAVPLGHPIVNLRGLPGPAPVLLMRMDPAQVVHRGRAVTAQLDIAGPSSDPLHRLCGGSSTAAGHSVVCDIGVPPAGNARSPRALLGLARNASMPVGFAGPRWFARRYLTRTM